jgi:hypothetical protein
MASSFRKTVCLALALGLSGCVEQTLSIQSNPPGAIVYLNGQEVGSTPLTRDFTFYGDYDVVLRKDGYQTLKTDKEMHAPIYQWVPLDLVMELMPFRVKDQRHWEFTLQPASTQPVPPEAILGRAEQLEGELRSSKYTRPPTTYPATTRPTTSPATTQPATQPEQ